MSNVTIVMYHYVRDLKHSRYPGIKGLDLGNFKEQLGYIGKHYKVIRMQDLFIAINSKNRLPRNSLLLTFDDGYKDHFEAVFPILDELGIQGSFFPSPKSIQEHRVLDVNKIHFILATVKDKKLLIKTIYSFLDKYRDEYGLKSNSHYYNKLAVECRFDSRDVVFIKRLLQMGLPRKLRRVIINDLFLKYVSKDEEVFAKELYMDIGQLKCMLRQGMYIGSHGWEHDWLNTYSKQKQENEIKLSLKFMRSLGCDVSEWAMCYPYGVYNDSLISLLRAYGCKLALTTEVGIADLSSHDPFILPRLDTNDLPKNKNVAPNKWTLKVIKS
jgi:peptidoglycan/xylan/chitin deacetylase (PgdA/CDA1 family)